MSNVIISSVANWSLANWIAVILMLSPLAIPLLFFLVYGNGFLAMRKGQKLQAWQPVTEEVPAKGAEKRLMQSAERLGLLPLGHYKDELTQYTTDFYRPYFSEDGRILMLILTKHGVSSYAFYSAMEDGVWLVSYEIDQLREDSSCFNSAMLFGLKPEGVFLFHRDRVENYQHPATAFVPESFLNDYVDQQRARAERLIEQGMAYWVSEDKTRWKGTLRGAVRHATRMTDKKRNKYDPAVRKHYLQQQKQLIASDKQAG